MMLKVLLLVFLNVLPFFSLQAQNRTRFHEYTDAYRSTPDQAKVLSSSLFGADGVEWFSGGGFQPDGTIIAAGTSLGPRLTKDGGEKILGMDQSAPAAPVPVQAQNKGKPKTLKDGSPVWEKMKWPHPNATGFIARYSADGGTLLGLTRLPWKSVGITDAKVDAQGNIYITGAATEQLSLLGSIETWPAEIADNPKLPIKEIYLAQLSPDASAVKWIRHIKGSTSAPSITIDEKGLIYWQGTELRVVDEKGTLVRTVSVPGGLDGKVAIHPTSGGYARYGERNSPTGREPWRCPILNVFKPDGTWELELYNWSGPVVGLDNLRLVSDSAIRGVAYDHEGNLILHAWSDGGNSVMLREPFDLLSNAQGFKGLGWNAWGAGVLSCAYVIKLDPETWRVKYGTFLAAYLPDANKPNSLWIDAMGIAANGSVCLAGRAAGALIQTGNHIGGVDYEKGGRPAGSYIKILRPDLSGIVFSSALPTTGAADMGDGATWSIISGKVGGKTRVIYFSSAERLVELYGPEYPTPLVNSAQKEFGGGPVDAYFVLLELAD